MTTQPTPQPQPPKDPEPQRDRPSDRPTGPGRDSPQPPWFIDFSTDSLLDLG